MALNWMQNDAGKLVCGVPEKKEYLHIILDREPDTGKWLCTCDGLSPYPVEIEATDEAQAKEKALSRVHSMIFARIRELQQSAASVAAECEVF